MSRAWFSKEDRFMEVLLKHTLTQHLKGWLDPCDAGSQYDCTILVPHTIEIKCDKKACATGNLYFETRNTRQQTPSGLESTQAGQWAHYLPTPYKQIILYDPRLMLAFLRDQVAKQTIGYRVTKPDGGDQNSQGIVAPIGSILMQPFVTSIPFKLELPSTIPHASGTVGRCETCSRRVAIEVLQWGICLSCRDDGKQKPRSIYA